MTDSDMSSLIRGMKRVKTEDDLSKMETSQLDKPIKTPNRSQQPQPKEQDQQPPKRDRNDQPPLNDSDLLKQDFYNKNQPTIPPIYPNLPKQEPIVPPLFKPREGQGRRSPTQPMSLDGTSKTERLIDISMMSAPNVQRPRQNDQPRQKNDNPLENTIINARDQSMRSVNQAQSRPNTLDIKNQYMGDIFEKAKANFEKLKIHKLTIDQLDPNMRSIEILNEINKGIDKLNADIFKEELEKCRQQAIRDRAQRERNQQQRPQQAYEIRFKKDPFSLQEIKNKEIDDDLKKLDEMERYFRGYRPIETSTPIPIIKIEDNIKQEAYVIEPAQKPVIKLAHKRCAEDTDHYMYASDGEIPHPTPKVKRERLSIKEEFIDPNHNIKKERGTKYEQNISVRSRPSIQPQLGKRNSDCIKHESTDEEEYQPPRKVKNEKYQSPIKVKEERKTPLTKEYITLNFEKENPVQYVKREKVEQIVDDYKENVDPTKGRLEFENKPQRPRLVKRVRKKLRATKPESDSDSYPETKSDEHNVTSDDDDSFEYKHKMPKNCALKPEIPDRPKKIKKEVDINRQLYDEHVKLQSKQKMTLKQVRDLQQKLYDAQVKLKTKKVNEDLDKYKINQPLTSGDETMRSVSPPRKETNYGARYPNIQKTTRAQKPLEKMPTVHEKDLRFDSDTDASEYSDSEYIQKQRKVPTPRKVSSNEDIKPEFTDFNANKNDDFYRLELGTPQQNQILQKKQMVEEQDKNIKQQELLLKMIKKNKPSSKKHDEDDTYKLMIEIYENNVKQMREAQDQRLKELQRSTQLSTHYKPTMEMPQLYEYVDYTIPHTHAALSTKNIKTAIDTFNPDKDPNQDFADTWRTVLSYTEDLKLDEKAYKKILRTIVQGQANRVVYDMNKDNKSLTEIIKALGDLYSTRRTILDDMQDVNKFKRKPGESIHTAMQRAKVLTERVKHLWPATTWLSTKRKEMLLSILKQIITIKTRKYIEGEEMKYWKTGSNLEYNAMLDLVDTYESIHGEIPDTELKLVINVCTSAPLPSENDSDNTQTNRQSELAKISQEFKKLQREIKHLAIEPQKMDTSPPSNEMQKSPSSSAKKRKLHKENQRKWDNPKSPMHRHRQERQKSQERQTPPASPPRMAQPGERPHFSQGTNNPVLQYHPPVNDFQKLIDNSSSYSFANQWRLATNPDLPNNPYHKKSTPEEFQQAKREWEAKQAQKEWEAKEVQKAMQKVVQQQAHKSKQAQQTQQPQTWQQKQLMRQSPQPGPSNYKGNNYNPNYKKTFVDKRTLEGFQGQNNYKNYKGNFNTQKKSYTPRNETPQQRIQRLKEYFCPDCKAHHKISSFCPNTGAPLNTAKYAPEDLNSEGSPQSLPGRAYLN